MGASKQIYWLTVVFAALLAGTAMLQSHLKEMPQLVMLAVGVLALLALRAQKRTPATVLFYLLLGMMLYASIFLLSEQIMDWVMPNRGIIMVDGEPRRVMTYYWMISVAAGLLLAPLALVGYHLKLRQPVRVEALASGVYVAVVLGIYLWFEVL